MTRDTKKIEHPGQDGRYLAGIATFVNLLYKPKFGVIRSYTRDLLCYEQVKALVKGLHRVE